MILPLLAAVSLAAGSPSVIYEVDRGHLSAAEQLAVECLQGIADPKGPAIWIRSEGVQAQVLQDLKKEGAKVEVVSTFATLIQKFSSQIRGAILYQSGDSSLNVATGLCGPYHAVALDAELEEKLKMPILLDVRGMTEPMAFAKYRKLYAPGIAVEQAVSKPGHLRDFAISHHAFVMDTRDREFRRKVISDLGPHALVYGWGPDEYEWITDLSRAGATGVAADWCSNLSFLERIPARHHHSPPLNYRALKPKGRVVAFVLSDGDNVQWQTGGFVTDPSFYGSPLRGKFPMTWEVSPLLAKIAPRILEKIYETATSKDDFVTGAGLPGYVYPHFVSDRVALAKQSAPYLRASGLSIGSFLNANEGNMAEADPWLDLPEMSAGIYKDYSPYNRRRGELYWHRGRPLMAYRFVLWEKLTEPDELARLISEMPDDPTESHAAYALVNVHAWSFASMGGPIEAVRRVIAQLPPGTQVVTASELFEGLRRAAQKSRFRD